jgi:hypothetical protein
MVERMNERIRELAEQAGFQYIKDEKIGWAGNYNSSLPKFAELIVRECVRYFNEDYQRDFDTLWREDLTKGIKEHFGVEE